MSEGKQSTIGFFIILILLLLFILPLYLGVGSLDEYLVVQKKLLLGVAIAAACLLGAVAVIVLVRKLRGKEAKEKTKRKPWKEKNEEKREEKRHPMLIAFQKQGEKTLEEEQLVEKKSSPKVLEQTLTAEETNKLLELNKRFNA